MSKITALPQVTDFDGNEQLVMVKAGATRRGAIGGLVGQLAGPYVAQAQQSAALAAASAQAAAFNLEIYADEAAGMADTDPGDYFFTPGAGGDFLILWLHGETDAEEIARTPSSAVTADLIAARDQALAAAAEALDKAGDAHSAAIGVVDAINDALVATALANAAAAAANAAAEKIGRPLRYELAPAVEGQTMFDMPVGVTLDVEPIVLLNGSELVSAEYSWTASQIILADGLSTVPAGARMVVRLGEASLVTHTSMDRVDGLIDTLGNLAAPFIDAFREPGDPMDDDTPALLRAGAITRHVRGKPGKLYRFREAAFDANMYVNMVGCYLKRAPGARYIFDLGAYHGTIEGGDYLGDFGHVTTTVTANALIDVNTVTVASAAGLAIGMHVVHASAFEAGVEFNRIIDIAGTSITLQTPLRGAVTAGSRFLADFPLIRCAGPAQTTGSIRDCWIRQCLFGLQSGDETLGGLNSFSTFDNIRFSETVGSPLIFSARHAGENCVNFVANGSCTQTLTYSGNGETVRFAYPYRLTKQVWRWGSEPSIRLFVGDTQLTAAQYTIDIATGEVVANVAPVAGADNVRIVNDEMGAFGYVASGIYGGPSSIERMTSGIVIGFTVGEFLENCELGFMANVQRDTCGYAAGIWRNCSHIHARAVDYLYSPFGLILDNCVNCSINDFGTSLMPDGDEFVPTLNKTELVIRSNCSAVQVGWTSWASASGHIASYSHASLQTIGGLSLTPAGLAIGGAVAGRASFYGTSGDGSLQIANDCKGLYFAGSGYHYLQAMAASATMRVGAPSAGGAFELVTGAGVALTGDGIGRLKAALLPVHADNAAALAASLPVHTLYKTATGELRVVV
jgi:hypothetical protein